MSTEKEKIVNLIKPVLWDTSMTADKAYEELNGNTEFGKSIKAKLLGYTSWYKLIANFETQTIFSWLDDEEVVNKLWLKTVIKKYDSIRRILSK